MAKGAAQKAKTKVTSRILGIVRPRHFNNTIAEVMDKNIKTVKLPNWSENDQLLAKAVQREVNSKNTNGLSTQLIPLRLPIKTPVSGGSDDIGDVS